MIGIRAYNVLCAFIYFSLLFLLFKKTLEGYFDQKKLKFGGRRCNVKDFSCYKHKSCSRQRNKEKCYENITFNFFNI